MTRLGLVTESLAGLDHQQANKARAKRIVDNVVNGAITQSG